MENKTRKTIRQEVVLTPTDIADVKGLSIEPNNLSSKEITSVLKERILSEEIDVLTVFAFLKKAEKIVKNLADDKEVKALLNSRFDALFSQLKHKKILGVTIGKSSSTQIDYSQCGHPELDAIDDLIRQLTHRKKQIQEQLNAIAEGETKTFVITKIPVIRTTLDGEQLDVKAPTKTTKPTIRFTT
jgi:hypothetical protein